METVVVFMSTYNGERYLRPQLDSILAQRDVEVRLLIRDDGSRDGTVDIIRDYQARHGNITLYQGENLGYVRSFMWLVNHCRPEEGCYYAFSDQDDVWDAEKLSAGVRALQKLDGEKPCLYYSDLKVVDRDLNFIRRANTWEGTIDKYRFAVFIGIRGCTMVYNRALQAMLYPCPVSDISGHDNYIGLVAFWLGQVVYDPNAYINYRQTGQNLSITGTTKWNKLMKNFAYFKIRMTRRRSIHERNAKELLSHYGETHGPELKELRAVAEYRQSLPKRLALLCNARFKRFSLPIRVFNDVLIILGKL